MHIFQRATGLRPLMICALLMGHGCSDDAGPTDGDSGSDTEQMTFDGSDDTGSGDAGGGDTGGGDTGGGDTGGGDTGGGDTGGGDTGGGDTGGGDTGGGDTGGGDAGTGETGNGDAGGGDTGGDDPATPGDETRGAVSCGEQGDDAVSCDTASSRCCIRGQDSSCVALQEACPRGQGGMGGGMGRTLQQTCDGAEDCEAGEVCCVNGMAGTIGCAVGCDRGPSVCHGDDDCEDGTECNPDAGPLGVAICDDMAGGMAGGGGRPAGGMGGN